MSTDNSSFSQAKKKSCFRRDCISSYTVALRADTVTLCEEGSELGSLTVALSSSCLSTTGWTNLLIHFRMHSSAT